MKKSFLLFTILLLLSACGGSQIDKHTEAYILQRVDSMYSRYKNPTFDSIGLRVIATNFMFDYDSAYCSSRYKALMYKAMELAGDDDIVIDYDHWTYSQDDNDFTYHIGEINQITDSTALAEVVCKNLGKEYSILLSLFFENDDWFVDDFLIEFGKGEKAYLKDYINNFSKRASKTDLWTVEAVESQIRACFNEVNRMGNGDWVDIDSLDQMFCSKDFLELKQKLRNKVKDSNGAFKFDGDEGYHWLPEIGPPITIDSIKSELLTGDQAQAELWLKGKNGKGAYLELALYLEDGAWKIHNWIDTDVYPFGALYNWMQDLLDGGTGDDEEEESELSKYAE